MRYGMIFLLLSLVLFISACNSLDASSLTGDATKAISGKAGDLTTKVRDEAKTLTQGVQGMISNSTKQSEFKTTNAAKLCTLMKDDNAKEIDIKKIQSYDDYTRMISSFNVIIRELNSRISSSFKDLDDSQSSYDKFTKDVTTYAPIIENYNSLTDACNNFDEKDEKSVNLVFSKSLSLALEGSSVLSGSFLRPSLGSIGDIYNMFGLNKFVSVCPSCVATSLGSLKSKLPPGVRMILGKG